MSGDQGDLVFCRTFFHCLDNSFPSKISDPSTILDHFYLFLGLKHAHFHGRLTHVYEFGVRQGVGKLSMAVESDEVKFETDVLSISNLGRKPRDFKLLGSPIISNYLLEFSANLI